MRTRGTCDVDGCDSPHHAAGKCNTHYVAARKAARRATPQPLHLVHPKRQEPPVQARIVALVVACPYCGRGRTVP